MSGVIQQMLLASTGNFVNTRSLTFTSASSQYLSRSWGATGTSNKKMTFSLFYKRASTGAVMTLVAGGENSSNNEFQIRFTAGDLIEIQNSAGGVVNLQKITTATFADTASWHNMVVAIDMDQAVAADRVKLFVDGTQITSFGTNTVPAAGTVLAWNNYNATYFIGRLNYSALFFYNGLLDEVYYIDGQQLAVADFASSNLPIAYAGTYGTRGFNLRFENNTSTTTLGADTSGNSNNWTLNSMTTANSSTSVP